MFKKTLLSVAAVGLLLVAGAAGASAQVTVSGALALAATDASVSGLSSLGGNPSIDSEAGFGGAFSVDYRLPVSVPISLGAEIGVIGAEFKVKSSSGEDTVTAVPLLLRVAYHFDNIAEKLDLYIVGKIGGAFGSWEGDYRDSAKDIGLSIDDPGGFAIGIDVGAAYYFTQMFGLFAELGFDHYALKTEASGYGINATLETPFSRFLTFGATVKF